MSAVSWTCPVCGHTVTWLTGPWVDQAYMDNWMREHDRKWHGGKP